MSITRMAISCAALIWLAWATLSASVDASPDMFGFWLSIAAWALFLAFWVLPAAAYRRWRAKRIRPGAGPWG